MTSRTDAQARAIETINENLAVNAGAGTGKTKVLTERYIEILDKGDLEEDREVESIVAISFTKKASQEMRERIRQEIRNNFKNGNKWRKFYRDMEKANISTIHSFCANILRENPLKAQIDPLFSILDESQERELLYETIMDILKMENTYNGEVYRMLRLLGHDELDGLGQELLRLYKQIRSNGDDIRSLKERTIVGIKNISNKEDLDSMIREDFIYLMDNTGKKSKFNKLADMEIWENFLGGNYNKDDRLQIIDGLKNYIGSSKKNQEYIDRLEENINLALLEKEEIYLWAYETIFKLLLKLDEEYSKKKIEKALLDYSDLEMKTYRLLRENPEIRQTYQDRYRYIMVDEFQDTNELQKNIFYSLCSRERPLDRNNLFVVGDPKQAIYGFRGGNVEVFKEVIEDIELVTASKAINMDKNFRSIDIIIDFVNRIFSKNIDDYDPLDPFKTSDRIKNIEIIDREDLETPEGISNSDFNRAYEASVIADRIDELVGEGLYDYGDIAILFRSRTHTRTYEDALRARNIPYYNEDGKNLYDRQEIVDIVNFLKSISTSYDRLSTIGFLRSPMVGLNDESIYRILNGIEDKTILKRIEGLDLEDIEENYKLSFGERVLKKYSYEKDIYSIESIVKSFLEISNYMDILALYEDGDQKISNVYKFLDIIRSYEWENRSSLEDFIEHLDRLDEVGLVEPEAKTRSESANLVRIMTIHKSKGLQFPVVILPEMSKIDRRDSGYINYNRDLGIGFKYEKNAIRYEELGKMNRLRDEEEAKRILYVAMTRGEELLIIGNQGSSRGFKKILEDAELGENIQLINKEYSDKTVSCEFREISKDQVDIVDDSLEIPYLIEFDSFYNKSLYMTNISQFLEFKNCRRKYYYNYYKPMPDIGFNSSEEEYIQGVIPALDRGKIVHRFCELYRGEDKYEEVLKNIVESFGYDYSEDVKRELGVFIDNYLDFYRKDYDKIYSEEEFYLKIEDTYISGIIDRIYVRDNLAYIYDFKTNLVGEPDELKDFYSPQLKLYAYAVEKLLGIRVEAASILFLKDGSEIEIDIDRESILNNIDELIEFVRFVEEHNNIEDYMKSSNCNYCNYRQICHR